MGEGARRDDDTPILYRTHPVCRRPHERSMACGPCAGNMMHTSLSRDAHPLLTSRSFHASEAKLLRVNRTDRPDRTGEVRYRFTGPVGNRTNSNLNSNHVAQTVQTGIPTGLTGILGRFGGKPVQKMKNPIEKNGSPE
jgi:hypothetical protein